MRHLIVCSLILFLAGTASADAAFQFTLPGLQAPKDPKVDGVRLSILYGKTQSLSGLRDAPQISIDFQRPRRNRVTSMIALMM
jgi:hypothetical protein